MPEILERTNHKKIAPTTSAPVMLKIMTEVLERAAKPRDFDEYRCHDAENDEIDHTTKATSYDCRELEKLPLNG